MEFCYPQGHAELISVVVNATNGPPISSCRVVTIWWVSFRVVKSEGVWAVCDGGGAVGYFSGIRGQAGWG